MFYFAECRLFAKDNEISNQTVYAMMRTECKAFHVFLFPYIFTAVLLYPFSLTTTN